MKNIISFFVSIIIIVIVVLNFDVIIDTVKDIRFIDNEIVIPDSNQWRKNYEFKYFKETDDFTPSDYDDLVEIFYTIFNNGWKEFSFYCSVDYEDCIDDVKDLSNSKVFLAEMSNFVHPYNKYDGIETNVNVYFDNTIEVIVKLKMNYTDEEIETIDREIVQLMSDNINDTMSDREKIKVMHDVIINKTKYDKLKSDNGNSPYDSERITGLLHEHYAVCSAYTEIMAVILDKLDIPNFMIASPGIDDEEGHIWNAVYLDNRWYHLDLTWDDPITTSGRNVLLHDYFLITDNDLTKLDIAATKRKHIYNRDIYLEFN